MSEFTLRELECFITVAEELSFTRAAERLRLAQPPLSRHIKALEGKLEVALFERSRRHVALTAAGQAFLTEARDILLRLRRAGELAKRAARGETDRIKLGFVSAVLSPELVEVFTRFGKRHPHIRMQLYDLLPSEQIEALAHGEIELGFLGVAPERLPPGLEMTRWREEELLVFLPPNHPLAAREEVQLAELADEPFVMISAEAAPAYHTHLQRCCLEAGFRPRIVQEAERAQAVAALTVAGAGMAILPVSLQRITGNGRTLRRAGRTKMTMTHSVAHLSRAGSPVARLLAALRR
ncbi:MAG: LysR family transcriptional regulator [Verrucomicrobiaceae bacterium]|nr:LysR family transcriptional regulator [Verrucomicrobiaceae bacterium]